jgi:hypothetical protein
MRAKLVEQVRHCRSHCDGIDIPAGELGPVFEKPLGQCVGPLGEDNAYGRAERRLLRPPGERIGHAAAGWIQARAGVPTLELAMINWLSQ